MKFLLFIQLVSFFTAIIFILCIDVFDYENNKHVIQQFETQSAHTKTTLITNNIVLSRFSHNIETRSDETSSVFDKQTIDYVIYILNAFFIWTIVKLNASIVQSKINQIIGANTASLFVFSSFSIVLDWVLIFILDRISELRYPISISLYKKSSLPSYALTSGFDYWFEIVCVMHIVSFAYFVYKLYLKLREIDAQFKLVEIFSSWTVLLVLSVFPVWSFTRVSLIVSCLYLIVRSSQK